MCTVPFCKAAIPTPEPPPRMEMFTLGFLSINASAVAWAMGSTVVEPEQTTLFVLAKADTPIRSIARIIITFLTFMISPYDFRVLLKRHLSWSIKAEESLVVLTLLLLLV